MEKKHVHPDAVCRDAQHQCKLFTCLHRGMLNVKDLLWPALLESKVYTLYHDRTYVVKLLTVCSNFFNPIIILPFFVFCDMFEHLLVKI